MRYGSEPLFLFNCGSDLNPYVGSLDCFVAGFDDAHKSDRFVALFFLIIHIGCKLCKSNTAFSKICGWLC